MSIPFKICGVTCEEDALCAAHAGAWAVGFVLFAPSPRAVTLERAAEIAAVLPPFVAAVAVLVDASTSEALEAATALRTSIVQLHGERAPSVESLAALRVIRAATLDSAAAVPSQWTLLLDASDAKAHGGTGRTIDWVAAKAIAATRRTILAGGLRRENVGEAIATARPAGIDLASGVEASPGIKDHDAIRSVAAAIRAGGERR